MLHLAPEALDLLDYLTLDDYPEHLARALYGPTWREAVRPTETGWRTSRDPLPAFVADFLAEVLSGSVAHDGRSTRESRSSGWWVRQASGTWQPVLSTHSIGQALHRVILRILTSAVEQHAEAVARLRETTARRNARAPGEPLAPALARELDAAERHARSEALRVAVLSALSHLVALHGPKLSSTFSALRDRLPLPPEARKAIAERWLDDAILVGDVTPDARGRISVAEVRAAYEKQAHSGDLLLPLHTLYRALDALLGPRARRIEWTLPVYDRKEIPA